MAEPLTEAKRILEHASSDVQKSVLAWLRERHPIHQLETRWRVPAEVILEAIHRAPDLSQRGVRGLIAEAYFDQVVAVSIRGWTKATPPGNHPFDVLLDSDRGSVRIQVKTQRRKAGRPMLASEGYRTLSPGKLVVETQRTRAGKDKNSEDTRPYRFDEFDILAVCMEPSTGDWTQFRYTLAKRLLPRPENPQLLLKFQPVSSVPDEDWTDKLPVALNWFIEGQQKQISP